VLLRAFVVYLLTPNIARCRPLCGLGRRGLGFTAHGLTAEAKTYRPCGGWSNFAVFRLSIDDFSILQRPPVCADAIENINSVGKAHPTRLKPHFCHRVHRGHRGQLNHEEHEEHEGFIFIFSS